MMCFTFPSWRSDTQRWSIFLWEIQCHWKQFSCIVNWPMKRSQSRLSSFLAELLAARLSSFAKFSGPTIQRRKPPGSEKKIFARTTRTFLLTNPNLEGEIHLKGGRFVTSQFSIWMVYIGHHMHIIFFCILVVILEILSNSRTQGESWRFHKIHIWIYFKLEKRINLISIFSLQLFPIIKINERR